MEGYRLGQGMAPEVSETDDDLREIAAQVGAKTLGVITPNEAGSNAEQAELIIEQAEPSAELTAKAKAFLRRYGGALALFSKDSRLNFVPSKSAKTFAFLPKTFEVEVPLSWYVSEKFGEEELNFANHHEIAHFIDMRKNPEVYLQNFERMKQLAGQLANDYLKTHPGKASLNAVKKFYYDQIHDLYNVLDDIYVNNLVLQRNRFFDSGDGHEDVVSLYKKLGFGKNDFTKEPLHQQMISSLLRDEMLGKEAGEYIMDERAKAVLEKIKLGRTIREIIKTELRPRRGVLVDPAKRYQIIRTLIEPEYLKLLKVAIEEKEEKPEFKDSGGGSGGDRKGEEKESEEGDDFSPFGETNESSDILDHGKNNDQVIEDILKGLNEANKIDKMNPEERRKYLRERGIKEFDKKHGITEEQRAESDRIKNEISKARNKMQKFWDSLIGKSIEYRQTKIHEQRRGRLNIGSYIKKYPEVIESERNGNLRLLEIYDRDGLERRIVDQPETIDVTLLIDCSGSMGSVKVEAAKKAAALLMYSIKDFNEALERRQTETGSKLRANAEVVRFGDYFDDDSSEDRRKLKKFDRKNNYENNDASIIKSITSIAGDRGGTDDASPLEDILARLTDEERSRIKRGKLKKIVFEITDGRPNYPEQTSSRLTALANAGVIVVGFQIGDVSGEDKNVFQAIWNNGQKNDKKRGVFVGEEIDSLPERLMDSLAEQLNDIVI